MAIISECGGKVYMNDKKWFEAFRQFQECYQSMIEIGHPRAKNILKYLILSSLLAKSKSIFMSTRPYSDDSGIKVFIALKEMFEKSNAI